MCNSVISLDSHSCLNWLFSPEAPTACFVIDEERLVANCQILDNVSKASGAKILLALKAYSAWATFPILSSAKSGSLYGVCASSVDEARLGREEFGGEVHAFAAAWSEAEIKELIDLADCITFNSLAQWRQFRNTIFAANAGKRKNNPIHCGLRVNPEHSEGAVPIYDPCSPGSRLGIRLSEFSKITEDDLHGLSGLHFHTLCEQGADALERTLDTFEAKFKPWFKYCSWFNFGGGHHITKKEYDLNLLISRITDWQKRYNTQIYLEPGEAVALNAGWLTATVLDIVQADIPVAILDVSAACHMPDVLEMPYTPDVYYKTPYGIKKADKPGEASYTCRLAGKSCLAGDVIGSYSFAEPLKIGGRLVFADMAIYSMVKTNTFNGLRLPSIGLYGKILNNTVKPSFKLLKDFAYSDFKERLS